MIFQRLLYACARAITATLCLQNNGSLRGDNSRVDWYYFGSYGPRMLIIKDEKVVTLTGVFSVVAKYDESGDLASCKFRIFFLEKDETLILGHQRVYETYSALIT